MVLVFFRPVQQHFQQPQVQAWSRNKIGANLNRGVTHILSCYRGTSGLCSNCDMALCRGLGKGSYAHKVYGWLSK